MRFPSTTMIKDKISTKNVNESINFLITNQSVLKKYHSIEDFILLDEEYSGELSDESLKAMKACEYHLLNIREKLHLELRSRNFFIGPSVLDEVLFNTFSASTSTNPLIEVLETIRNSGVLQPGIVVFPLHSLGVLGGGLLHTYTQTKLEFHVPALNLIVSPQTNSLTTSFEFIKNAALQLGTKKKFPDELLMHWYKTRPVKWLKRNPLLVFKVHSFSGQYYENQFFIVNKLRIYTTALLMLNKLQNFSSARQGYLFSSSKTNNWETLDIKHYFVFSPKPYQKELIGNCIPMNVQSSLLAEISNVPTELDPKYWSRKLTKSHDITESITKVEKGYFKYALRTKINSNNANVYRKLFKSLEFLRRSYRTSNDVGESAVNLAVAFEILLTDFYAPGISHRIIYRMSILLKGQKGIKRFKQSVEKLYIMRSEYVHSGFVEDITEINIARTAFIYSFLNLCKKLDKIPLTGNNPMEQIIHLKTDCSM